MNPSQAALRRAATLRAKPSSSIISPTRQWVRYASDTPPQAPRRRGGKAIGFLSVFAASAAAAYYYPQLKSFLAPETAEEETTPKVEVEFEKARKQPSSKEDNRGLISSQHLQVKSSWEHPGVYAWGSNTGKVIDPTSKEKYVKLPRRLPYFDDQILRDLKLTQNFGAALTEKGDLVQWGLGFDQVDPTPAVTLKGKDLVKVQVSTDRVIAMSKKGAVYSIPTARNDLEAGAKQEEQSSSWSLWSSTGKSAVSFRELTPTTLARSEKIVDISSGQQHCLMLTSKGRVFSAASSALEFPDRGQMGIPGLSWATRQPGAYDQAYEVMTLKGFDVAKIAAGDLHSVVLDKTGRVFTFGDNTFGQLGIPSDGGFTFANAPTMLPINKLYGSSGLVPHVTSIAAGGLNTFFTVDAKEAETQVYTRSVAPSQRMPRITSDVWGAGQGVYGSLGTGKWTHVSLGPTKLKSLSSLFEFDEVNNKMMPIRLKALTVGTTHCAAVMDNVTETAASRHTESQNSTNWGADVLFWGGNEHYQLGTGKRANLNAPTYIGPLDGGEGDAVNGRPGEVHRLCLTPKHTVRLGEGGKGRKATLEQKVECGRFVTGVYSST